MEGILEDHHHGVEHRRFHRAERLLVVDERGPFEDPLLRRVWEHWAVIRHFDEGEVAGSENDWAAGGDNVYR